MSWDLAKDSAFYMSQVITKAILILAVTLVVYIPAVGAGYIWDDDAYVTGNRTLRSVDGLGEVWFKFGATPQYYPLVHTSYWLEYRLWGLNPAGYHVVNILLHAIGAVLLWRILELLKVPGAFLAGVLFAVHPVHVESVAWITERKNLLSGVFYLGSALCYLRYALADKGVKFYAASLILFICALLSKTVTATLPAALLLVLWLKYKRIRLSEIAALVPLFVIGVGFGLLTVWMERWRVGAVGAEWDFTFVERFLIAGRAVCFYIYKLIFPLQLTFIYSRWDIDGGLWWQYLFIAVVVLVIGCLWFARRRIGMGSFAALAFFVVTLFPALGFFNVYPMRFSFVADHFQYLASIGPITLAAGLASIIISRFRAETRNMAMAGLVLVLLTLGVLTWRQCRIYKDLETLWTDTLAKNPDAWMAHTNLGLVFASRGHYDQAMGHYRRAIELKPDHAEAHNDLGVALERVSRVDEAHASYRRALQLRPDYAEAHYNMGNSLAGPGRLDEAVGHFRQAVKAAPGHAAACNSLGLALKLQGRIDEAISYYRRAVEIDPDYTDTRNNLGSALAQRGEMEEAISQFQIVLDMRADDEEARFNLALALNLQGKLTESLRQFKWLLESNPNHVAALVKVAQVLVALPNGDANDLAEAVDFAKRAAELTGYRDTEVLVALADSYAAAGRSQDAVSAAQKALSLAARAGNKELMVRIRSRLRAYKQTNPQR